MHQELEVPLSYYETLTKKEIKKYFKTDIYFLHQILTFTYIN